MEATTETTAVEREIAIAASPETVWQFLVDPDKAIRWMGQTASFDPRPGGAYRIDWRREQVTPRLTLRIRWDGRSGSSTARWRASRTRPAAASA